jgi:hypothetical protein
MPNREREDGGHGEERAAAQDARRVANVLNQRFDERAPAHVSDLLLDRLDSAELQHRHAPCLGW